MSSQAGYQSVRRKCPIGPRELQGLVAGASLMYSKQSEAQPIPAYWEPYFLRSGRSLQVNKPEPRAGIQTKYDESGSKEIRRVRNPRARVRASRKRNHGCRTTSQRTTIQSEESLLLPAEDKHDCSMLQDLPSGPIHRLPVTQTRYNDFSRNTINALFRATEDLLDTLRIDKTLAVPFKRTDTLDMDHVYRQILGNRWQKLIAGTIFNSWDVVVALTAAFIHSQVFACEDPSAQLPSPNIPPKVVNHAQKSFNRHESKSAKSMNRTSQQVVTPRADDQAQRADRRQHQARIMAGESVKVLVQHLGCLHSKPIVSRKFSDFKQKVAKMLQDALLLREEIAAGGDEVVFDFFEAGTQFDLRLMDEYAHASGNESFTVKYTLVTGFRMRQRNGEMICLIPAVVQRQ